MKGYSEAPIEAKNLWQTMVLKVDWGTDTLTHLHVPHSRGPIVQLYPN